MRHTDVPNDLKVGLILAVRPRIHPSPHSSPSPPCTAHDGIRNVSASCWSARASREATANTCHLAWCSHFLRSFSYSCSENSTGYSEQIHSWPRRRIVRPCPVAVKGYSAVALWVSATYPAVCECEATRGCAFLLSVPCIRAGGDLEDVTCTPMWVIIWVMTAGVVSFPPLE